MDDTINQLITVGAGLIILAGAWLIWLISGVANNLFSARKWSWKRMGEDVVKTLIMGVGILSWVILLNSLEWYTAKLGMDISALLDGATVVGLLAVIVGGSANYAYRAYKNFVGFIGDEHVPKIVGDQDYSSISADVKEMVVSLYTSLNTRHEADDVVSGTVISKKESRQLAEMGFMNYRKVDVETPEDFYKAVIGQGFNEGWGMQCVAGFKEFMYSLCGRYVAAGGAASGYASEPARSAVCKLGFTWHDGTEGLKDGCWGIWANGLYGHVAMYYQGKWLGQNQGATDGNVGNAFNLSVLPMAGFAGYFLPNIYTSTPATTLQKEETNNAKELTKNTVSYTYQKGDTFGEVIVKLGLATTAGLWGDNGDVAYYTNQLHAQGITGNIGIGTTIILKPRT